MKIVEKDDNRKPFKDLRKGEVFEDKDGDILMVVSPAANGENVVNLKNGDIFEYSEEELPTYYNSMVTVYPNAAIMLNGEGK